MNVTQLAKTCGALRLAIIRNPRMTFKHGPISFDAFVAEGVSDKITLANGEAFLRQDAGILSIGELDGRPCWVDPSGDSLTFVRLADL